MSETQASVDALAAELGGVGSLLVQGVQELRDEIDRLQAVNPAINLDGIRDKVVGIKALAEALASDNIPAAPVDVPDPEPLPDPDPAPVDPDAQV